VQSTKKYEKCKKRKTIPQNKGTLKACTWTGKRRKRRRWASDTLSDLVGSSGGGAYGIPLKCER